MALRWLSTEAMVSLSKSLTTPSHADHKALLSVDVAAGLVPKLDRAVQQLLKVQAAVGAKEPPKRLGEIQRQARAADLRHDALVRGVDGYLAGTASIVKDEALGASLESLRGVLFPEGLSVTQRSYREEAGAVEIAKKRLTDEHRELLASLKTPEGTLLDAVNEWFRMGDALGRLEDERASLEAPAGVAPADVLSARNDWIRVMNAIRAAIFLADEVPAKVAAVLRRIEEAEQKAAREPDAGPEPTPDEPARPPTG